MGVLYATPSRGKEIFAFEYDPDWLAGPNALHLDPSLRLFAGPQYAPAGQANFGVFLGSCPDRWGRALMRRREAQQARAQGRGERKLLESDYLLGVHDRHRMGALRFRTTPDGPFLDDNDELAAPPWTSLRELEHISLELERDDASEQADYGKWPSAMTLLQRTDSDDATSGTSYLELAELLMRSGSRTDADLEQLWRRTVFFMSVSNTDDHLRNHGFLLDAGWRLAPAYDIHPDPAAAGLKLNVSESDNTQDLDLALEVAPYFRVEHRRAKEMIKHVLEARAEWLKLARRYNLSRTSQEHMAAAFAAVPS